MDILVRNLHYEMQQSQFGNGQLNDLRHYGNNFFCTS
jgi:hypothetical protein